MSRRSCCTVLFAKTFTHTWLSLGGRTFGGGGLQMDKQDTYSLYVLLFVHNKDKYISNKDSISLYFIHFVFSVQQLFSVEGRGKS